MGTYSHVCTHCGVREGECSPRGLYMEEPVPYHCGPWLGTQGPLSRALLGEGPPLGLPACRGAFPRKPAGSLVAFHWRKETGARRAQSFEAGWGTAPWALCGEKLPSGTCSRVNLILLLPRTRLGTGCIYVMDRGGGYTAQDSFH